MMYCKFCGNKLDREYKQVEENKGFSKRSVIVISVLAAVILILGIWLAIVLISDEKEETQDHKYDEMVADAITVLKKTWTEEYKKMDENYDLNSDGYLEIKNTRVIQIEESPAHEMFSGIEYVIEFSLLSDYYGSAPYYIDSDWSDTVVVYKDGSCEVIDLMKAYCNHTYDYQYEGIIEDVTDLDDRYNDVFYLN